LADSLFMDRTLQQLLTLAEKGTVEQRCAALLVAGALKLDGAVMMKTIAAVLQQPNPILKDYALRYCEEVKPRYAVPLLAQLLDDNDKEMQERAVRLLSAAGQGAVELLLQRVAEASRPWQLNAARVLCAGKRRLRGCCSCLALAATNSINSFVI
jgi:phage gp36-like protein